MKFTLARYAAAVFSGLFTFWLLRRVMDRDTSSAHAAIQRQWLVVGLLLAGAYVVLRHRHYEGPPGQPDGTRATSPARSRQLGFLGWVFLFTGAFMAFRLLWQMSA